MHDRNIVFLTVMSHNKFHADPPAAYPRRVSKNIPNLPGIRGIKVKNEFVRTSCVFSLSTATA